MKAIGFAGCFFLLLFVTNVVLGGYCTQYTVNTWGPHLVHHPVHVGFWPSAAVGLVAGEVTVPAAAVTWLLVSGGAVK